MNGSNGIISENGKFSRDFRKTHLCDIEVGLHHQKRIYRMSTGHLWLIEKLSNFCKCCLSETCAIGPIAASYSSRPDTHAICDRIGTDTDLSWTHTTQTGTLETKWCWGVGKCAQDARVQ